MLSNSKYGYRKLTHAHLAVSIHSSIEDRIEYRTTPMFLIRVVHYDSRPYMYAFSTRYKF